MALWFPQSWNVDGIAESRLREKKKVIFYFKKRNVMELSIIIIITKTLFYKEHHNLSQRNKTGNRISQKLETQHIEHYYC